MSNPFLPSPPKWLTWPLDVCREVGYGRFYWFSLRIFSQTSLELEIFSPRYNGVRFFSALNAVSDIFFRAGCFFPGIYLHAFFLPKSACRTFFFLKSPITPSKVKWSAPKIHQTFGQLTDSDLSIISKGFWNNRDKTLKGRGEEFVSTYPHPESPYGRTYRRTYVDVITNFSWMDSLPNFITHVAQLRALRAQRLR